MIVCTWLPRPVMLLLQMTEDMNRATKDIDVKRDVLKALKKEAIAVKNKAGEWEVGFCFVLYCFRSTKDRSCCDDSRKW